MHVGNTALPPDGLLCDLLRWPDQAAIVRAAPRFSWVVRDRASNMHQMAYHILVAQDLEALTRDVGDMWDSGEPDPGGGWTTDATSLHVPYAGSPLSDGTAYCWKVRTWNSRGQMSPWSEPQTFTTGELVSSHATARQKLARTAQAPQTVVRVAIERTFVDFGKAAFGTITVALSCPRDGVVTVCLGEVSTESFELNRCPGGTRRYGEFPLEVKQGRHTYTLTIPSDPRNTDAERTDKHAAAILMPEDVGEVYPFRYCEIVGAHGTVRRDDISRLAVWYPFAEDASAFVSSDPVLNDVWELCRYSMKATSFCGVHVDGDRERIPYEADAYINQLGYYCCDREYALSRYTHEFLVSNPTWPTEWVLFSVLMAWADFEYTGDTSSLVAFYDDLRAKALLPLAREDGLLRVEPDRVTEELLESIHIHPAWGLRNIVDWPQGERDGYDMQPVNTVVNAFHYRALELLSRIANALGKSADASLLKAQAKHVREAMLTTLVDEETGLFVDGEGSEHCSLHANMFALAFGVATEDLLPAIVSFIEEKGMACSVYGAQFLLEGLYQAGADTQALALMTSRCERSWAHWVYELGSTITLEAWGDRFKPNQDWNHAWGGAPANIIPRFLMGVRPLDPGFARILIAPQPAHLTFAQLTTPTIRGPVTVRIRQTPGEAFQLDIDIPANTSARVVLPRDMVGPEFVLLDGTPASFRETDQGIVLDSVGSGPHSITCI